MLITQITERKAYATYTFREIMEADELEKAFRLRYEILSYCMLSNYLKKTKNTRHRSKKG
jgi:hypothetical protein